MSFVDEDLIVSPETDKARFACACAVCAHTFLAVRPWAKVCSSECERLKRRSHRHAEYARNPQAFLESARRWRLKNPEAWRAIVRKSQTCICIRCGEKKRPGIRKALKSQFVCGTCRVEQRHQAQCFYCGRAFRVRRSLQGRNHRCPDCLGLYSRVARNVGVSRQRVEQLVNKALRNGNITRRDAAMMILHRRETPCRVAL